MFYDPPDFVAFLEATRQLVFEGFAMVGVPLEMTTCFHQGTGEGPRGLRVASDNLEDYCPLCDRSLLDRPFADLGDLDFEGFYGLESRLNLVRESVSFLLGNGARPLLVGGEHSLSAPSIQACHVVHPDLCVIQFDGHADLRNEYLGTPHSHASVMARVLEVVPVDRVFQVGVRSGTREEWQFMRTHGTVFPASRDSIREIVGRIGKRPTYVTLDLDVLDSSVLPGTGTPEPGGVDYATMEQLIVDLSGLRIVGADVVELAPPLDPTGVSSVVAAKVVRTILLNW